MRDDPLPPGRLEMICVILVAGHGVLLEREIQVSESHECPACMIISPSNIHHVIFSNIAAQEDSSGDHAHLIGIPKALLPARPDTASNGDTILDYWWAALKRLVCNGVVGLNRSLMIVGVTIKV